MAPNSLIFLIIIGVWAAYLGKYWLRRRDHLATARSMDRFSESIRVLGQGRVAPTTDVHRAPHRSYAVTPGGPMRPQVTVKRSVAPGADGERWQGEPGGFGSAGPRRRLVARGVRGVLLLVALAAFVVSVPLAVVWDRFPVWGPVVVLANAVAAFLFLRAAAQEDIAVRRDRAGAAARPVRRRTARAEVPVVAESPVVAAGPAVAEVAEAPVAQSVPQSVRREERVFDDPTLDPAPVTVVTPQRRRASGATDPVPVEADDDIPATWDPRPVPTPTYAMKQRADHQIAPADVPVPEPIELEDDDEVSFSRVSGA